LEGGELLELAAGYHCQHQVAVLEVLACGVEVVAQEGAAAAAFRPAGTKHEVIYDQLASSAEEVGEGHFSVRSFEDVFLVDLHPWELAALGGQTVTLPVV